MLYSGYTQQGRDRVWDFGEKYTQQMLIICRMCGA